MFTYAKPEPKTTAKNPVQKKESEKAPANLTGIPDAMKAQFENLSGFSFDDVRIHYYSDKPTQLQALAYTQGNQVYIAPGQEKHLRHELGHVVQQKQGRVRPTRTVGGMAVNDDPALESEADKVDSMPFQFRKANSSLKSIQKMDDIKESLKTKDSLGKGFGLEAIDKAMFLLKLREVIVKTADELLAQIHQTSDDCPFISKWFDYYAEKDKAHIERAIARFSPEAVSAANIDEYINSIANRVKIGLQNHIDTGSVDEIPDEIMTEQYEPQDFLHIAQKFQPITQFSETCKGKKKHDSTRYYQREDSAPSKREENPPLLEHEHEIEQKKPPRTITLIQGQSAIAEYGAYVSNLATTACALVMGFGEEGVACYHLPFMQYAQYSDKFRDALKTVSNLTRIAIITYDFPEKDILDLKKIYTREAKLIKQDFSPIPTSYYVIEGKTGGDIICKLIKGDFECKSGDTKEIKLR